MKDIEIVRGNLARAAGEVAVLRSALETALRVACVLEEEQKLLQLQLQNLENEGMLDGYGAVLSVEQVADLFQCSRDVIYDLCRKGSLPALKVGGRIVISRAQLRRFLAGAACVSAIEQCSEAA